MMVLGIAVALVVVALAIPRHQNSATEQVAPPPPATQLANAAVGQPLPPSAPAAAVTVSSTEAPVSTPAKKTSAPKPRTNAPVESTKVARTEAAVAAPAEPAPLSAAALAPVETAGPPPVTITGCLEMSVDATEFRLTDTDGVDAPKSRSWRSGFLKKSSAAIALVDAPDAHALVGKRVAATGLLTSHSMKVSTLRVVTPSCS
jgi:hypothetical protein